MADSRVLAAIVACGLAMWALKVIPFLLVRRLRLPAWLLQFLSFVPVAILTAIFVENLLVARPGNWPAINWPNALASVPALLTAVITKSLLAVVVVGVVAMAALRFLGWA
ncbi:AzlD domain-containing protein [Lacticaseibacillus daqingensis]|uniref:AzlD domain-containing protein n=1 Tax=Lacticaseibacillus daqingensis TaxID=2486014 RepID=UPI000F7856FD|nr:AzlD domain-containing protein [Lacticaseibacillus daqingensis]